MKKHNMVEFEKELQLLLDRYEVSLFLIAVHVEDDDGFLNISQSNMTFSSHAIAVFQKQLFDSMDKTLIRDRKDL